MAITSGSWVEPNSARARGAADRYAAVTVGSCRTGKLTELAMKQSS